MEGLARSRLLGGTWDLFKGLADGGGEEAAERWDMASQRGTSVPLSMICNNGPTFDLTNAKQQVESIQFNI